MPYLIFLAALPLLAATNPGDVEGNFARKIASTIGEIESLSPESFAEGVLPLRERVDRFLNDQKRICRGEFSTIVLSEFGEMESGGDELKKLDENERKLCLRELKNIQISFINALYRARHRYLTRIHAREMEGLETMKKESVDSVQKAFSNI